LGISHDNGRFFPDDPDVVALAVAPVVGPAAGENVAAGVVFSETGVVVSFGIRVGIVVIPGVTDISVGIFVGATVVIAVDGVTRLTISVSVARVEEVSAEVIFAPVAASAALLPETGVRVVVAIARVWR